MVKKDILFSGSKEIDRFKFDEQVADVFPDMLRRSIPGYATSLQMIEMFAGRLSFDNCNMYDLGSSLGAATQAILNGNTAKNSQVFAIDNSPAMIRRAYKLIERIKSSAIPHLVCADILDIKIKRASLVVLNYTLQFLNPSERKEIIRNIFTGLVEGGALLLAEKIAFDDSDEQGFQTEWYHNFKEFNGYSKMEISRKRTALENVLIPDSWETHKNRLKKAGFKTVHLWHRFFSFASIIAIK